MPIAWMSKLRQGNVAGDTWKVLGFHLVSFLSSGSGCFLLIYFEANTEVFDSSRDNSLTHRRSTRPPPMQVVLLLLLGKDHPGSGMLKGTLRPPGVMSKSWGEMALSSPVLPMHR